MLFAGIDVGSLTAEAVAISDGRVVASEIISVLPNPVDSAAGAMAGMLGRAGIRRRDIEYTISTGYGRDRVQAAGMAQENLSEITCHGVGAHALCAEVRTVIDIGGQDAKVIRVDENGDLVDFVMNDKCAAGTGHFLEIMSRALGVTLDELGGNSLRSSRPIQMSNRCSIYVETEVIHFLQRGAARADLAAGINRAMAERVLALIRRVSPEREMMLTGGVAKNGAVRSELEKMLKVRMVEPGIDPQLIGAYGAAVLARRRGGG